MDSEFAVFSPISSPFINFESFEQLSGEGLGGSFILQGFRKIDADKWEFANEGFLKGKRHLLKNIQRRKSQQAGSSSSSGSSATVDEIEKLRKEKSLMMQEVIELQQQQRGTVQQMEAVNEKLQAAEQKQKQMVSFLAKVFQNPTFLTHLQQMKEQGKITSPRTTRKFVKHQPHDPDIVESSMEGQIVKYRPNFQETGLGAEAMPLKGGTFASEGPTMAHELLESPDQVIEKASDFNPEDSLFDGKNVASPQLEVMPEYFASPGIGSMVKEEEVWNMSFEASAGMSSTGPDLWGSLSNYVPDFGVSSGLSDLWDIDPLQAAGISGVYKWPDVESPFALDASMGLILRIRDCNDTACSRFSRCKLKNSVRHAGRC
ncbi:hypothetical protein K7X08_015649 [Anisodus acutangulus]|uniref:Uncharacterized protein n=1 Tax=Anisodus acutangulus TaxID=402998 RepID=A0A9Q1QYF8_9SOLA|nr:hypothetical protein K7X08_015649 [Anisodus acutangulus]